MCVRPPRSRYARLYKPVKERNQLRWRPRAVGAVRLVKHSSSNMGCGASTHQSKYAADEPSVPGKAPDEAQERQRQKNEAANAYAADLEAQMRQKQRKNERAKAEEAERERREEMQTPAPVIRGGGGEPFRDQNGNIATQLHLLKEATGEGGPRITGGELLERTKAAAPLPGRSHFAWWPPAASRCAPP